MDTRAAEIKNFLLQNIEANPKNIVAVTEANFNVTRTTVHRHLNSLIRDEKVFKSGTTINTQYTIYSSFKKDLRFKIHPGLSSEEIWKTHFIHLKSKIPSNVYEICQYGFLNIFNNAIEHSGGTEVHVSTNKENSNFKIKISDDGIGVFKKIKDQKSFKTEKESVLQISKGMLTTKPQIEAGEGLFFTSKVFDYFSILSSDLLYSRDNNQDDWLLVKRANVKNTSTMLQMEISLSSEKSLSHILKNYRGLDANLIVKTNILVNLSLNNGDRFASREQAKQILANIESFKHVTLDFRGIKSLGSAFVDEVFYVSKVKYPNLTIETVNTTDDIQFMIEHSIDT